MPYTPSKAMTRIVSALAGDTDVRKSALALARGLVTSGVLKITLDMTYWIAVHEDDGSDVNTSVPVLLADEAIMFAAMFASGFITARRAPARPLRHAVVSGLPWYVGGLAGIFVNWGVMPAWHYVAFVFAAFAGACAGAALNHVIRAARS